jgi:serine acetyltransferase
VIFFYHMVIGYQGSIGKLGGVLAVPKTGYRVCIGPGAQSLGFAKVGDQREFDANSTIIVDIYQDAIGVESLHQLHRRSIRVNLYRPITMTSTQGNAT